MHSRTVHNVKKPCRQPAPLSRGGSDRKEDDESASGVCSKVAEKLINCFLSPYALGTRTALLRPRQGGKGAH